MRYEAPVTSPGMERASMIQPYCFQAVSAARHLPVTAHTNNGTTDDSPSRQSDSNNQGGINA